MAQFFANGVAGIDSLPVIKASSPGYNGTVKEFQATITLAAQAAADTIVLAEVPAGYKFLRGFLVHSVSLGGTATVAIGTAASAGKYRAAATSTGVDAPAAFGLAAAAAASALTATERVILTIAAAALPASGTLVVSLQFAKSEG